MNDNATPGSLSDGLSRVSIALGARRYDVVIGGGRLPALPPEHYPRRIPTNPLCLLCGSLRPLRFK